MHKRLSILASLLLLLYGCTAQNSKRIDRILALELKELIRPFDAKIGIAVLHLELGDTLSINNLHGYPMQSVYKFPLAIAVLHQVDKNKISLQQKINITKADLNPNTWSPLQKKFPDGEIDLTVAELLDYTVSKSDNNTCDVLFRLMKGTQRVEKYIHGLGYKNIAIKTTEAEMAVNSDSIEKTNWCHPLEMVHILAGFHKQEHLSERSNQFLMKLMVESSNSDKRIKGMLPPTTMVAHKTGTGNHVVNDVGIISLPDGGHVAIAIFIQHSKEPFEASENMIAKISRTVYSYLTEN
jgi:beta-lactamase class A